jgi:hypothetical protein
MVIGYCHKNQNVARKRSIAMALLQVATFFSRGSTHLMPQFLLWG